jgi:gliding motility-associated lipoprotein GldD
MKFQNIKNNKILLFSTLLIFIFSCSNEISIPKPSLYLRAEFPKHEYIKFQDNCPYKFEIAKIYSVKNIKSSCHKDIDLGQLNGIINFSYIKMTEHLSKYVNYSNDKVGEHKIKATGIKSENFIFPNKKVYGTFFKLEGDVATPFQFYITDSLKNFASGVIYFNTVPNYDSLKQSIEYLEIDLHHLINTFEWIN